MEVNKVAQSVKTAEIWKIVPKLEKLFLGKISKSTIMTKIWEKNGECDAC